MNTNVNNNESGNMEVMNQVIVRLNEIKSVKLMNVSQPKRPAAKFNKEVAKYLLSNWDNLEQLKTCQLQMRRDMPHTTCTEVMDMYDARVAELQAALEKENEPEKSVAEDTANPEPEVAESQDVESETVETQVEDDNQTTAETEVSETEVKETAETEVSETAETETAGIDETTKSDKSSKKQQAQKKSDKTKKRPGAPKTLKVGDRHKNGKWLWTEYEPGKFDWRTDPAIKAKNAAERAAKLSASKSTTDAGEAKPKAQKKAKAAAKTNKAGSKSKKAAEPKKADAITIDEMLSRKAPSGLSKAQKNVLGLLKKGYRLTMIDNAVFLQKDDDRKSVEVTTVKALIERYKLEVEPTGLWIK